MTNQHVYPKHVMLLGVTLLLALVGLLMVTSASMALSLQKFHHPWHYTLRQSMYVMLSGGIGWLTSRCRTHHWYRISTVFFIITVLFLWVTAIPGIGITGNGSQRWIGIPGFYVQMSEWCKLTTILCLAKYIYCRQAHVATLRYIVYALLMVSLAIIPLLLEPDFGTSAILLVTCLLMLFLSAAPWRWFIMMTAIVGALLAMLITLAPYRLARMVSFMHPWQFAFDKGYQLTQSLIAFGRGGWLGVGIGNGIQKWFYLPEGHTDFIVAIVAEELGCVGVMILMGLLTLWESLLFWIGYQNFKQDDVFAAFIAYGIGLWTTVQMLINFCVSMGLLPTKGLTLPLISYGGNSLMVIGAAIGIVWRMGNDHHRGIDFTLAYGS
jgi:cell division protein FtsW